MYVSMVVSTGVAIDVEYVIKIVSFYLTVHRFLIAEEEVAVYAD